MEKTYYHVVTEHPMKLGEEIIFDEDNHSGVYTPYAASVGSNQKFIYTNSSGALTAANFEIWVTDT